MIKNLICSGVIMLLLTSCTKDEIALNEELFIGSWEGQKVDIDGEEVIDFEFYDFFGTGCFFVINDKEYAVCYQAGYYAIESKELILPFSIYPGGNQFTIVALSESELIIESRFTLGNDERINLDSSEKGKIYTITRYYEKN